MNQWAKVFAVFSVPFVLLACGAAPMRQEQEVAPQTFRASVSAASGGNSLELWHGLYQRAQNHCEARQRTAIGLREQGLGTGGRSDELVLVFKCDTLESSR